mmetsp:Transcript_11510/g.34951  ORF Transcript_11510/g.34951 Transcript_11510/m.34951 type:complete len:426 (-) Transcript_11510:261-1538(-)
MAAELGAIGATPAAGTILCCLCGVAIPPNPVAMCAACVAQEYDITEGIPRTGSVSCCKKCGRWETATHQWVRAERESGELLTLCLRRVGGGSLRHGGRGKVQLKDAGWVWTEPHSRRLKFWISVQGEVESGATLRQRLTVEFKEQWRQCDDCSKEYTGGTWKALVQLRQRADHKRTMLYLEQRLIQVPTLALTLALTVTAPLTLTRTLPGRLRAARAGHFAGQGRRPGLLLRRPPRGGGVPAVHRRARPAAPQGEQEARRLRHQVQRAAAPAHDGGGGRADLQGRPRAADAQGHGEARAGAAARAPRDEPGEARESEHRRRGGRQHRGLLEEAVRDGALRELPHRVRRARRGALRAPLRPGPRGGQRREALQRDGARRGRNRARERLRRERRDHDGGDAPRRRAPRRRRGLRLRLEQRRALRRRA